MPFGIKSSSQVFHRTNEAIFGNIPGVHNISDDIISAAKDGGGNDHILERVLDRAREVCLKFNSKKFKSRVREVKYVGSIVSEQGLLRLDEENVKAITDVPSHNALLICTDCWKGSTIWDSSYPI